MSGQANEPLTRPAHALEYDQVLQELEADSTKGLSSDEAIRRLARYGSNDLGKEKGVKPFSIFIQQIVNAMTAVCQSPSTPVTTALIKMIRSSS